MPITIRDVQGFKDRGERFVMLTVYESTFARILDEAEIPLMLVGDTLSEMMLGHPSTVPVTVDEMLHHTKAVTRVVENALVVGDLPFGSYQVSVEEGMRNAARFLKEANTRCVKMEGATPIVVELIARLVEAGVPVMGHLGLTPQAEHQLGGRRVQGRTDDQAELIREGALRLQDAGAFALVLEAVPANLAREVTDSLSIPTIGIGAGPWCDGQVLVFHDFLGITPWKVGKFVKSFASMGEEITRAARRFADEVASGTYPSLEESYT
ncbi:MAG TPA: 3-methyl-2-oxobutanoate hydroxymethyltransferase [Actinomycetota bacterium]|jgi:3-methyl-2-oxobutanoate hydroxymethyltransferase